MKSYFRVTSKLMKISGGIRKKNFFSGETWGSQTPNGRLFSSLADCDIMSRFYLGYYGNCLAEGSGRRYVNDWC